MPSRGLWRWYINTAITILDIIHHPVFYLQLNSIGLSVPHMKHIPSLLLVQQVNAIYRFVTMVFTILDIIHHSVFYLKHNVLETGFCLRLQVEPTQLSPAVLSIRPKWVGSTWRRRQNQDLWYYDIMVFLLDMNYKGLLTSSTWSASVSTSYTSSFNSSDFNILKENQLSVRS
jgi:hypothetical protein